MPELPDITLYVEALEQRIKGKPIEAIRLASPFLLRTTEPQLEEAIGREVVMLRRIGKRVAIGLEHDLWLVFHLMLAGRFSWKPAQAKLNGRHALAAFDFLNGALILTEYGARKRASLHVVESQDELAAHDPGGLEVLEADLESFCRVVRASSHRLKRTLTDPHLLSGIGNSYADEILHRARLSPMALCANLDDDASALVSRAVSAWNDPERCAIVATHGAKRVKPYAIAGVILGNGKVVREGSYVEVES